MSSVLTNEQYAAPAVLGAEYCGSEAGEMPERLYIPVQAGPAGDEVGVALRRLVDSRLALLVYSDERAIAAGCGEHQSWIAIRSADLQEVRHRCAADVVLWDAPLPADLRERGVA
jgi:hypothetical protein